jgi:uncharacterized membrane protein YesL
VTSSVHGTSIGQAIRLAAVDFYFNSLRFVPANLAWAAALLAVLFLALIWPPALALLTLLAVPLAGMHRMAALLTRGEAASFSDFVAGMRRFGLHATGIMAGVVILAAVLVTNALTGFASNEPLGWFIGATALWGLVALAMAVIAVWPILVDPRHEDAPLRRRLQRTGLVVIGRPGRLFVLTLLVAVILVASTALLGAIVLVGVAYSSLLATRWVLPTIDELEARYEAARAR